jgi:uncharacterized membrane protein (UPF0127 family)
MNIEIKLKNKKLLVNNVRKAGAFGKFRGLMFRRVEKAPILLFDKSENASIHSFFVFFRFVCVWLDEKNNVVECRIVEPFEYYVKPNVKFSKILEVPINRRYDSIVTFLVGERFK